MDMESTVVSLLQKHGNIDVKDLRKEFLKVMGVKSDEKKATKKKYKELVLDLDKRKILRLDTNGTVQLLKRKRDQTNDEEKEKKKAKKEKKKLKETQSSTDDSNDQTPTNKKKNPGGVTRLFLGNLPFAVDEDTLQEHFSNSITHINWITDNETGKFYGSAFVEVKNAIAASDAVALAGEKLMGRPLKVNYAPARPGDQWPPEEKITTGGLKSKQGRKGPAGMTSAKPPDCVKLFLGNLSYEITDESLTKFLVNGADAEPKAIRWIHHSDTGDFKGV